MHSLTSNKTISNALSNYIYGFQGQEMDDEIKDIEGSSIKFGNRIYDPRIARFLSTDRFENRFANQSPYVFAGNTPIWAKDVNGDSVVFYSETGKYLLTSYDNERYKGQNFIVIINDNDIANFREEATNKMNAEIPKAREKAGTGKEYTEATLAGLKDMGVSHKVKSVKAAKSFGQLFGEMTRLQNKNASLLIKIEENKERVLTIDEEVKENNKNIGEPDAGDPKGGLALAKIVINTPKWKEENKLNLENDSMKKQISKNNNKIKNDKKKLNEIKL